MQQFFPVKESFKSPGASDENQSADSCENACSENTKSKQEKNITEGESDQSTEAAAATAAAENANDQIKNSVQLDQKSNVQSPKTEECSDDEKSMKS